MGHVLFIPLVPDLVVVVVHSESSPLGPSFSFFILFSFDARCRRPMPPRPTPLKSRDRPLSAIFIGSTPSTPASSSSNSNNNSNSAQTLPDLPEPPSPVSSVGSGLPSPPATNSTGSGSTGDPASVARRRMTTTDNSKIGSEGSSSSTRSSSRLSLTQDEYDLDRGLDQDEDQTMRLKIGAGAGPSNESVLQRARSLAQRNRLQLDKLASGKLGRASPSSSSSSRNQRHSMPDPSQVLSGSETEREGDSVVLNSTSTTSSSSKSSTSHTRVRLSSAPTSPHRARVQHHASASTSGTGTSPTRRRKRVSMAHYDDDDDDGNNNNNDNNYSASDDDHDLHYDERSFQVGTARDRIRERAPTVNLNSLKKTPLAGTTRRRSALPREFRQGPGDEHTTTNDSPQTPSPLPATTTTTNNTANNNNNANTSPSMSTLGRRSTLRGARGLSDDYRNSPSPRTPASITSTIDHDNSSPTIHASRSNTMGRHTAARRERGQTLRGGSAESALGSGRSLVGEGLRAAGLSRRVGVGTLRDQERERAVSTTMSEARERERELDRANMVSRGSNRRDEPTSAASRVSASPDVFSREMDWSPVSTESFSRRQSHRRSALDSSDFGSRTLPPRASTSMADYSYTSRARRSRMSPLQQEYSDSEDGRGDGDVDDDRRRALRAYKSPYGALPSREASLTRREQTLLERERELSRRERELDRDRERAGSVLGRHTTSTSATPSPYNNSRDRDRYPGAFGSTRRTPNHQPTSSQSSNNPSSNTQSEHVKLMVDSLTMFESQLVKLSPSLGLAGTNHLDMLTRNAQSLVVNAERLNTILKSGNSRALDAQIEAEVEGDYTPRLNGDQPSSKETLVDVWRKVGADYREGVRVSDDLVRAVTGLLLGVGRVMKEYVYAGGGGSEAGSVYGGTPRGVQLFMGEVSVWVKTIGGGGAASPEFRESSAASVSRRSWEGASNAGGGGGSSNASVSTGSGNGPGPSGASGGGTTGSREEALRRLAGVRSDSPLARASPAFHAVRELDRLETASPSLPKVNIPGTRRLFAPSQQREMALVNATNNVGDGAAYDPSPTPASRTRAFDQARDLTVATQQQYQHSPLQQVHEISSPRQMPMSVQLERSRTLTLPSRGAGGDGQVYETPLRRNMTLAGGSGGENSGDREKRHERRKISIASITTIRGGIGNGGGAASLNASSTASSSASGISVPIHHHISTLSTPSGATTAVTLDTNSNSDAISVTRTGSTQSQGSGPMYSTPAAVAKPTFSRPEGITGLQQQLEGYRRRVAVTEMMDGVDGVAGPTSDASASNEGNGSGKGKGRISLMTPESERELRRNKTLGVRGGTRMSLDGVTGGGDNGVLGEFGERSGNGNGKNGVVDLSVNAADRSAAATVGVMRSVSGSGGSGERRRTVTDIWPRS
ncbi:hypothetical protein D9756_005113 [Leucocoprinus leucothites]|uniref:Uncharacterized protein n=1 Tax=Leucocoprinus leucothites TaxID=201217 RepID=A0A8H5G8Y1_9AGAR|nr:hypothetical protein D9756_005113 [Leucoagaricus leucothites]